MRFPVCGEFEGLFKVRDVLHGFSQGVQMFGAGLSILSGVAGLGMSAAGGVGSPHISRVWRRRKGGRRGDWRRCRRHSQSDAGQLVCRVRFGGDWRRLVAIGGALTGVIVAGITPSVRSAVAQSQGILARTQANGSNFG